jgi:hypothetical protein
MIVDRTFPITIFPGQVQIYELFMDAPIIFPAAGSYVPFVRVSAVDPSSAPPDDCRHQNDDFVSGAPVIPIQPPATAQVPGAFWQVVTRRRRLTGRRPAARHLQLRDGQRSRGDRDLGGVPSRHIPVADVENHSIRCRSASRLITDTLDFVTTLLRRPPADALMPFALSSS